jgi:hypothetical protein
MRQDQTKPEPPVQRISWIWFRGTEILQVDFSHCTAEQVQKVAQEVPDYVTVRPRGSVIVITDFSGASFNKDALRTMKETAVFDKPFVKKSAFIGAQTLPHQFYEDLKIFSRRVLPIFESREEALEWLVAP